MEAIEKRSDAGGAGRDIACFLGLALVWRAAFALLMPRVIDTADAVHYIDAAKHFAGGDFWGIDPKIPMLYPALAAVAHLVVPDFEWACVVVSLAASVMLVIPVYALSRDMHGRGAARVGALLVSIWPWLVDFSVRVGPDALGCTLWFTSVCAFALALRRGRGWLVAAPVAFFALHLTRPEGTVLMAASVVGALVLCLGAENRRLWRLVPIAITAGVLLAGYVLYMRGLTGGATVNYRVHFIVQEFDLHRFLTTALRTFSDVLPVMLGPALLVFLGVGLFQRAESGGTRDARLEGYVLFFAAIQWAASLFVLSPEPRYLMTVIVALSLWSARGMVLVGREAAQRPGGRWLKLLPVLVVVLLMLVGTAATVSANYVGGRPGQPLEYKAAGRWMKEHLDPGLIFTRKPQVGYYADMPSTGPDAKDTLEEAIARAKAAGARYVVVDERYTTQMAPGLAPLLDPKRAPPELRHVQTFDLYPKSRVVIYEIVRNAAPPS